jgi:hypothetical protein
MSATNGKSPVDTIPIAQSAAAERIAAGLVVAFGACEEAGVGLSEVQKVAFIQAMLLQFDGFADNVRSLEGVGRLLGLLGDP